MFNCYTLNILLDINQNTTDTSLYLGLYHYFNSDLSNLNKANNSKFIFSKL